MLKVDLFHLMYSNQTDIPFIQRYLEQRDKTMHQKAKAQIKECYGKKKTGDPIYKNLTRISIMKTRLRATVGEKYWKKAHDYLEHFLRQKQTPKGTDDKISGLSSSSRSTLQQQRSTSSVVPSPNSSAQPSSRTAVHKSQAAAMKMPLESTERASGSASASTATSGMLPPTAGLIINAALTKMKAKKANDENRSKQNSNERNRKRRAELKRKREEEVRRQLMLKKHAQTDVGVTTPSTMNPADPSLFAGTGTLTATTTPATIGDSFISTTTSGKKLKEPLDAKK